jgi:DNA-binding transcriptional LysR family regulator
MDRITSAKVFITIVERGSMAAAADTLDISRSMVTRYLAEMENWADARLLHRSTRKIGLTPAGEEVLQYCKQLLSIADALPEIGSDKNRVPKGTIRIGCCYFTAQNFVADAVQEFLTQYPEVSIELAVNNQLINLVENRIDLAIRITDTLDPVLIARPLGICRSVTCASPEYLKLHGTPQKLEDLIDFNCMAYANFGTNIWHFDKGDEHFSTPINGNFNANSSSLLLKAAIGGSGICQVPLHIAHAHLESGELVEVLGDYKLKSIGIYGVYRSREYMPIALRKMIDRLVDVFEEKLIQ